MKLVYIAGPFRAPTPWQVEQNVRRAESLALSPTMAPSPSLKRFSKVRGSLNVDSAIQTLLTVIEGVGTMPTMTRTLTGKRERLHTGYIRLYVGHADQFARADGSVLEHRAVVMRSLGPR